MVGGRRSARAGKKWAGILPTDDPRASLLYGELTDSLLVLSFAGTAGLFCADARRLSARFLGKSADDVSEGNFEVKGPTHVGRLDIIHVCPMLHHCEVEEVRKQIVAFVTAHSGPRAMLLRPNPHRCEPSSGNLIWPLNCFMPWHDLQSFSA